MCALTSIDVNAILTRCRYDNAMTRCAENDCVKILCIVSCLWIIGWPLKLMLGYDDNSSLTAYYRLLLVYHTASILCIRYTQHARSRVFFARFSA
jgi:hypothetical protein